MPHLDRLVKQSVQHLHEAQADKHLTPKRRRETLGGRQLERGAAATQ